MGLRACLDFLERRKFSWFCHDQTLNLLSHSLVSYSSSGDKLQGTELNGTHQFMVFAGNVHILTKNINMIKKITGTLLFTSKEVSLKYILRKLTIC